MESIFSDKKIILFTGNYGSGKTEISVNYTINLALSGKRVSIADLDLVNPYFRCREARQPLEALGVKVAAPAGKYHNADLPILLPEIRGMIAKPEGVTILDVGGDNAGATVLASLSDVFREGEYEMYFVVNMNRPFTNTVEGVMRIMGEVEAASRLKTTVLAGNTHLMDETTVDNIIAGAEFTGKVSQATGLPVAFIGVMEQYLPDLNGIAFPFPIMPMKRLLLPPWAVKTPPGQTSTHSRDGFGRLVS